MVDMTQLQAMYGGTFDPVHYGHLKPVEILANQIGLNRVTIVPNNVPPHRPQPEATSDQRRHMLELAIADSRCLSSTIVNLGAIRRPILRRPCASGARSRGRDGRWRLS